MNLMIQKNETDQNVIFRTLEAMIRSYYRETPWRRLVTGLCGLFAYKSGGILCNCPTSSTEHLQCKSYMPSHLNTEICTTDSVEQSSSGRQETEANDFCNLKHDSIDTHLSRHISQQLQFGGSRPAIGCSGSYPSRAHQCKFKGDHLT